MPLISFVTESNRIEGIQRAPLPEEIGAHGRLLRYGEMTVAALEEFTRTIAGASLRRHPGMDVRVGNHFPPEGGPGVEKALGRILLSANAKRFSPYDAFVWHQQYEAVHPFMDGNGRSGRALWLWMMGGVAQAPLGFLHHWYYQSLEFGR